MPPIFSPTYEHLFARSSLTPIQQQWHNPTTILAVLSVIGGDIIHRATAQLAGNSIRLAPVTLSFGWTGFLLSFILSLVGDGRALPRPDCSCTVVDVATQAVSQNKSWVLGRLVRDKTVYRSKGLHIAFYDMAPTKQGVPSLDWIHYLGFSVMLVQFALSLLPGALYGDWNILVVTIWGILLGLAFGTFPQWKQEKWSFGERTADLGSTVCLIRGKDIMVIRTTDMKQPRLVDLANAEGAPLSRGTVLFSAILCLLQMGRLLTIAGLHDHAWFSLAIACIGTLYNCIAAGASRDSDTTGIHLQPTGYSDITEDDVLEALKKAENSMPSLGLALLPAVTSGLLPKDYKMWREATIARHERNEPYERDSPAPRFSSESVVTLGGDMADQRSLLSVKGDR